MRRFGIAFLFFALQARASSQEAAAVHAEGMKLYASKNYEAALVQFKKAAELDPSNPDSWQGQGNCLYFLNRKEEALPAFETALALKPDDAKLRAFVEKLRSALGQKPAAQAPGALVTDLGLDLVEPPKAAAASKPGPARPEVEVLIREGERRLSSGDPWGAMDAGEKALGLDPGNPEAQRLLARAYQEGGFERLARSVEKEAGFGSEPRPAVVEQNPAPGERREPKSAKGKGERDRRRYKRSSGGRLLAAFPMADSVSRAFETYQSIPSATADKPSLMGDFELNSRYNLGRVEFEAALLCFSFRRGLDIYDVATNFQKNLGTRATVIQAGLRYAIPAGSWTVYLGGAAGYIRASAEYSDNYSSGTFTDDGLEGELSLGAERFVSPQISVGPILRYRFARMSNFKATSTSGLPAYLSEYDAGSGPDLYILDNQYLATLPGARKAVIDMGGISVGLELQYHY